MVRQTPANVFATPTKQTQFHGESNLTHEPVAPSIYEESSPLW